MHAERDPAALKCSVYFMFPSLLQKNELSSRKRNHESAGFGVVQTSTCSGVIFSRPWNIQYHDWVSRSSGQISSCFSSWPNSLSRKIKMFPGKPQCILAQSDDLCSSSCFTPQTGQPGRLKIALRELTVVALEVASFYAF